MVSMLFHEAVAHRCFLWIQIDIADIMRDCSLMMRHIGSG
jgi:hypothetical protein